MFSYTKSLHLLLYICIVWPSLVLAHSYPVTDTQIAINKRAPHKALCYIRAISTHIAAALDCRGLIKDQVIDGPGPFASSTAWKQAKDPNGNTIWSVSSPTCAIGFLAPPNTSPIEWTKYHEGILAISRTCVDPEGLGGTVKATLPGQPNHASSGSRKPSSSNPSLERIVSRCYLAVPERCRRRRKR